MKKKLIAASVVAALALSMGSVASASAHDNKGRKGEGITNILGGLVTKGTLTQAQADAITKAMTDARDAARVAHDAARAEHIKVITDTMKSNLKDRVTAHVEATKGMGKGHKGHDGHKGKGRGGH